MTSHISLLSRTTAREVYLQSIHCRLRLPPALVDSGELRGELQAHVGPLLQLVRVASVRDVQTMLEIADLVCRVRESLSVHLHDKKR